MAVRPEYHVYQTCLGLFMFIDTDSDDSEGNQDELQNSAAVFLLCGNGS